MLILNLELQSIKLIRTKINDQLKKLIGKVSTMNNICKIATENISFNDNFIKSL